MSLRSPRRLDTGVRFRLAAALTAVLVVFTGLGFALWGSPGPQRAVASTACEIGASLGSGAVASSVQVAAAARPQQAPLAATAPDQAQAAPDEPQAAAPAASAEPEATASIAPVDRVAGRYVDSTYGFAFDYPQDWTPNPLGPGDAPGSILGLPAAPVPGSVEGVEFPYSSHVDLSLVVQDGTAGAAGGWGTTPEELLGSMASSQGFGAAAKEGTIRHKTNAAGVELWRLTYARPNATQHMWVVARSSLYNYLFFLTVGGAADDRGTAESLFERVLPSFRIAS
jgi:hypothetical protein